MCYARRQRSSWARIKLSKILYHFTFRCNNLFSSFCSSFTFCLSSISSQFELFEYTSHFFVFALYLSLCCSIFNDRLTQLSPRLRLRSRGDLSIISHCLLFVNTFFKTFLSFFRYFLFPSWCPSWATACILYHFRFRLSIPFWNFFKFFWGLCTFVY